MLPNDHGLPKPFLVLAPMDDVTDTVFRQIVHECAPADLYMTEFVNVDGLQSPGREKLLPKLKLAANEGPVIAQIWGKNPDNYYKTTKELHAMGFVGVDINMGCPVKNVVQSGCCSALINNRGLTGEILSAVGEAAREVAEETGQDFPVSVKTRLGLKEIDYTWHEFLLQHKLNMLTIHARTTKEMSKVPAHWDDIAPIRELRDALSPTTLLVGNGDVESRAQAEELAQKYNLDGVMIGRGVFTDPFVFTADSPWAAYSKEQKIALYRKHVQLFADTWKHNERRVVTLNKFCKVYINGFDGAKELREQLMTACSSDKLLEILDANSNVS
ncbi:tRNA-dihydrouridine synthase [Candidatus Saccharibacteria bacterium]|nr:tRNA-dihydrouridine synthase [Candidatus Saccharibacteria bacterium]